MMPTKTIYVLLSVKAAHAEIGCALGMLEDARHRTLRQVHQIPAAVIDWQPYPDTHSLGTLLYHIAAIEADWLYSDVLQSTFPAEIAAWFPYDVRDSDGKLTRVTGETLDYNLERLEVVRAALLKTFTQMPLEDFRRLRTFENYDVTPEWVLHHLCQHEAEHRAEIAAIKDKAKQNF